MSFQIIKNLLLIVALVFLAGTKSFGAPNDTIIAVVNDDVITFKNFQEYLTTLYMQLHTEGKSPDEIAKIMEQYQTTGLERLIEDKLILNEANKKEMAIRDKLIDDKMEQIKKSYPTEVEFLKALVRDGLTVTELRKKVTDQLKVKFMVEMEIKSKVFVSPAEITQYYQEHLNDFVSPESVDLDSIFLSYSDGEQGDAADNAKAKQSTQQKAEEAAKLLKGGVDFATVAKRYPKSSSIGLLKRGQMLPDVEAAIFKLNIGEVSDPIATETGIFVFKLKNRFPEKKSTLEESRDKIYGTLYSKKLQNRLDSWLKDLKKKAYIEIKG